MDTGTKVNVRGTKINGVVINVFSERNHQKYNSPNKIVIATVEHEDKSTMQYVINELRAIP